MNLPPSLPIPPSKDMAVFAYAISPPIAHLSILCTNFFLQVSKIEQVRFRDAETNVIPFF